MQTTSATHQLQLIAGQFSATEAKEILIDLYMNTIHFHELKNFSSQIRGEKQDDSAQQQIAFLKEELQKLQTVANEATFLNKKLIIKAEIQVSVADEN